MVVAPLSILLNWEKECNQWAPHLDVVLFHGARLNEVKDALQVQRSDIIITTYQTMTNQAPFLKKINWNLLVLDEGHAIKNDKSLVANAAATIHAYQRIILTGSIFLII